MTACCPLWGEGPVHFYGVVQLLDHRSQLLNRQDTRAMKAVVGEEAGQQCKTNTKAVHFMQADRTRIWHQVHRPSSVPVLLYTVCFRRTCWWMWCCSWSQLGLAWVVGPFIVRSCLYENPLWITRTTKSQFEHPKIIISHHITDFYVQPINMSSI